MKQQWRYGEPVFEADKYDETILRYSPWAGHRRFAYDLVSYYEPEVLVELGSHYGASAFSFMQAVKDQKLNTRIYAVDLWNAADRFTANDYEQDIYQFFNRVRKGEFDEIDVHMLKMSFDHANTEFEDHTIDILHIDGSHDYKDVRHDFALWISKVKEDGIILIHDISEQIILGERMGSSIFWDELKKEYTYTVEMQHSWGLGILFLSEGKYIDFKEKADTGYYLRQYIYDSEDCKDKVRKDYFKLRDAKKWIDGLKKDKQQAEADSARLAREISVQKDAYEHTVRQKEQYIAQLQDTAAKWEREAEKIRQDYEHTIQGKDAYIKELEERLAKRWKPGWKK